MLRRYHLDARLLVFIALAAIVALAAMSNQNNLLFWVFGVMVALLLISGVISGIMMMGLRVHRLDPRHGAVGEPLIVRYRLTNHNRLMPAFSVHVEDLAKTPRTLPQHFRRLLRLGGDDGAAPPADFHRLMRPARAWVMHVGPGETVHGEAVFWPLRRGAASYVCVRIWTSFPFGLVRKSITFCQPVHTLIHPRRYELRRGVLRAITPAGPLGMQVTQHPGAGDDYYGLREYRPGDSLRRISWRRTAALDQLVCVESARSSPPRLRVVIDLTAPAQGPSAPRALEEDAISLASSILHAAHEAGYEIGLSVLGLPAEPLPVRHGRWHLGRLTAALAALDLEAPRSGGALRAIPDAQHVGLVVIHPQRAQPGLGRADTWHLTAAQLPQLAAAPVGWDPHLCPPEFLDPASDGTAQRDGAPAPAATAPEVAA